MTKAAAAAVLALEALMPQRAAATQHAGIPEYTFARPHRFQGLHAQFE